MTVKYIDRKSGQEKIEQIYGEAPLKFLYGNGLFNRVCLFLTTRMSWCSKFYGWWQKRGWTRQKILPFIEKYEINTIEFLHSPSSFTSFNDFFCRKLKSDARPIIAGDETAIIPADGRYLVYSNLEQCDGICVKGKRFSLVKLLGSETLAREYAQGGLVIARLCPTDYHRFFFPVSCLPGRPKSIRGVLFSVNPIALLKNIHIFTENKRQITELDQTPFGKVLFIEVGATNVGTIHQTYTPSKRTLKGEEKGYFSFGGSSILILFPKGSIEFSDDLLKNSHQHLETYCKLGEPLGRVSIGNSLQNN
ncbi:MAG: phosphatidylserine decarboxylase [Chlamydiia bacterium]|nr:phosphatidylserine decarboxylase [Chlamydiia bacterium]